MITRARNHTRFQLLASISSFDPPVALSASDSQAVAEPLAGQS
jgi:hypothetical protein